MRNRTRDRIGQEKKRPKSQPESRKGKKLKKKIYVNRATLPLFLVMGIIGGTILGYFLPSLLFPTLPEEEAIFIYSMDDNAKLYIYDYDDSLNLLYDGKFSDYENITASSVDFIYGVSFNDTYLKDLSEFIDIDNSIDGLIEQVEDAGYREEDCDIFMGIYPSAVISGSGGLNIFNLLSDRLIYPEFNSGGVSVGVGREMVKPLKMIKNRDFILENLIFFMNFSVWKTDTLYNYTYNMVLPVFMDFSELTDLALTPTPENIRDHVVVKEGTIALQGTTITLKVTEVHIHWFEGGNYLKGIYVKAEFNGRATVFEILT